MTAWAVVAWSWNQEVARHLEVGGLAIIDFWKGPGREGLLFTLNLSVISVLYFGAQMGGASRRTPADRTEVLRASAGVCLWWSLSYLVKLLELVFPGSSLIVRLGVAVAGGASEGLVGYGLCRLLATLRGVLVEPGASTHPGLRKWVESWSAWAEQRALQVGVVVGLWTLAFRIQETVGGTTDLCTALGDLPLSVVFAVAVVILATSLVVAGTRRRKPGLLGPFFSLDLLVLVAYAVLQFADWPLLGIDDPLHSQLDHGVYVLVLLLKLPFAVPVFRLARLSGHSQRQNAQVSALILENIRASVALVDRDGRRIAHLAGPLFGLGEPSEPAHAPSWRPLEDLDVLAAEDRDRIIRFSNGPLPAETLVTAGAKVISVHLGEVDHWEERRHLFPEVDEPDLGAPVSLVGVPVRRLSELHLRSDAAMRVLAPLRDSFHELSRPIAMVSMLLDGLRRNRTFEAALRSHRKGDWDDLCLAELLITRVLYPQVRYLGIIEKVGRVSGAEIHGDTFDLGTAVEEAVRHMVAGLVATRYAPHFSSLGIPPAVLDVLASKEDAVYRVDRPSAGLTVCLPRAVVDLAVSELLLNALKRTPVNLEDLLPGLAGEQPDPVNPILFTVSQPSPGNAAVRCSNLHQPQGNRGDTESFLREIYSRPLGGLASTRLLLEGIDWKQEIRLESWTPLPDSELRTFAVTLRGPTGSAET